MMSNREHGGQPQNQQRNPQDRQIDQQQRQQDDGSDGSIQQNQQQDMNRQHSDLHPREQGGWGDEQRKREVDSERQQS